MLEWQVVQAWYCVAWLCAGPIGWLAVKFGDGEWHCRQSVFTLARLISRGFGPPCGKWQAVQPSVFTTKCSYTNGPAVSLWHFVQTASICADARRFLRLNVPCASWQSVHFISPSSTLWWKGMLNCDFVSVWHWKQSFGCSTFSNSSLLWLW